MLARFALLSLTEAYRLFLIGTGMRAMGEASPSVLLGLKGLIHPGFWPQTRAQDEV